MNYQVISPFRDKEDNLRSYEIGELYPREGHEPTVERIESLVSDQNAVKKAVIRKISQPETAAEPSNSSKKRKKNTTVKAEQALHNGE